VLRISRDGTLLYANPASHRLLEAWGCTMEAAAQRIFAFARVHEQLYVSLERGRVQLCEYLEG
jgi:hypothetical protein